MVVDPLLLKFTVVNAPEPAIVTLIIVLKEPVLAPERV